MSLNEETKEPTLGETLSQLKREYQNQENINVVNEFLAILKMYLHQPSFIEAMKEEARQGESCMTIYRTEKGFLFAAEDKELAKRTEEFHKNHRNKGPLLKKSYQLPQHKLTVSESSGTVWIMWG
jgi:hypothetical protein